MFLREWTVIGLVLGFFCTLVCFSKASEIKNQKILNQYEKKKELQLSIKLLGQIEEPGVYTCKPGITLKELLSQVKLSSRADRKKIPYNKVLFSSQTITIPEKKSEIKKRQFLKREKNSLEEK